MTSWRRIIGLGTFLGVLGAAGQMWLLQFGVFASAPLRSLLSLSIAVIIGVIAGTRAGRGGVKVATLMGLVAGAILTAVGLGALVMNPELLGLDPLMSAEAMLILTSSLIAGIIVSSWLLAGVAAFVAWPISAASVVEVE